MELAQLVPRSFTVAEFNRMARAGIFAPDERVELLDGPVIPAPPMGRAHWSVMLRIGARIHDALAHPEYWIVAFRESPFIDVFREPHDLGYASLQRREAGDTIAFTAFPDVVFRVEELIG